MEANVAKLLKLATVFALRTVKIFTLGHVAQVTFPHAGVVPLTVKLAGVRDDLPLDDQHTRLVSVMASVPVAFVVDSADDESMADLPMWQRPLGFVELALQQPKNATDVKESCKGRKYRIYFSTLYVKMLFCLDIYLYRHCIKMTSLLKRKCITTEWL